MIHELDLADLAQVLSRLSGDLVLVIDAAGQVLVAAQGAASAGLAGSGAWEGRPWADAVTPETRHKVGKMLQELASSGVARRRELNHPTVSGDPAPFAYHAVRLGDAGLSLAMGRDLGPQKALQQGLLEAQRQLEAGRWR